MKKPKSISRRQFVKGNRCPDCELPLLGTDDRSVGAIGGAPGNLGNGSHVAGFLARGGSRDGSVTVFTSKVELGTGIETALAQIVAEELDVPFARRSRCTRRCREVC